MGAANRKKGSCMVRKQTGRNAPAWLESRQDERPLPGYEADRMKRPCLVMKQTR